MKDKDIGSVESSPTSACKNIDFFGWLKFQILEGKGNLFDWIRILNEIFKTQKQSEKKKWSFSLLKGWFVGCMLIFQGVSLQHLHLAHTSIHPSLPGKSQFFIGGAEGYHRSMKHLGCHRPGAYFWCHAPKGTAPRWRENGNKKQFSRENCVMHELKSTYNKKGHLIFSGIFHLM